MVTLFHWRCGCLCPFLKLRSVGLLYITVACPGHTHLLFKIHVITINMDQPYLTKQVNRPVCYFAVRMCLRYANPGLLCLLAVI